MAATLEIAAAERPNRMLRSFMALPSTAKKYDMTSKLRRTKLEIKRRNCSTDAAVVTVFQKSVDTRIK